MYIVVLVMHCLCYKYQYTHSFQIGEFLCCCISWYSRQYHSNTREMDWWCISMIPSYIWLFSFSLSHTCRIHSMDAITRIWDNDSIASVYTFRLFFLFLDSRECLYGRFGGIWGTFALGSLRCSYVNLGQTLSIWLTQSMWIVGFYRPGKILQDLGHCGSGLLYHWCWSQF